MPNPVIETINLFDRINTVPGKINYNNDQLKRSATTDIVGLIQIATEDEVTSGVIANKAITPFNLKNGISHKILSSTHTDTGGIPSDGQFLKYTGGMWQGATINVQGGDGQFVGTDFIPLSEYSGGYGNNLDIFFYATTATLSALTDNEMKAVTGVVTEHTFEFNTSNFPTAGNHGYLYYNVRGFYVNLKTWYNNKNDYIKVSAKYPDDVFHTIWRSSSYPEQDYKIDANVDFETATGQTVNLSTITTAPSATDFDALTGTITSVLTGEIPPENFNIATDITSDSTSANNFQDQILFIPFNGTTDPQNLEIKVELLSSSATTSAAIVDENVPRSATACYFKIIGVQQLTQLALSPDVDIINILGSVDESSILDNGYIDTDSLSANTDTVNAWAVWNSKDPSNIQPNWENSLPIAKPDRCNKSEISIRQSIGITPLTSGWQYYRTPEGNIKITINWDTGTVTGFGAIYRGGGMNWNPAVYFNGIIGGDITALRIDKGAGPTGNTPGGGSDPFDLGILSINANEITKLPIYKNLNWNVTEITVKHYKTLPANRVYGSDRSIVILRDKKNRGDHGGSSATTAWTTRDLNEKTHDTNNICVLGPTPGLSDNEFSLIPGKYLIKATAPTYGNVNESILRLYNITDATIVDYGTNSRGNTSTWNHAFLTTIVDIAETTVFRIDHYTTTEVGNGFGVALNITGVPEIYTVVEIEKLDSV